MTNYNFKVCILGAYGVGKTSLVRRYIHSIFSDKYLSTIGTKISKKSIKIGDKDIELILWDISGQDEFSSISKIQLTGSFVNIVLIDPTRKSTVKVAQDIIQDLEENMPDIPILKVISKADIPNEWELTVEEITEAFPKSLLTSAKTGLNVDSLFASAAEKALKVSDYSDRGLT